MNILFLTDNIQPNAGGIERVLDIQVEELTRHGHQCFVIHRIGESRSAYKDRLQIQYSDEQRYRFSEGFVKYLLKHATRFADENEIDVVVNTRDWPLLSSVARKIADHKGIKHINYIHHQIYGLEETRKDLTLGRPTWKRKIKKMIFPLYWLLFRKKINRNYRRLYWQCDEMVILSEGFRQAATTELSQDNGAKISVIPNPTAFEDSIPAESIKEKENTVLIVARMEDASKNISGALRIWKDIEKSGFPDWRLKIVGDGPDLPSFKAWAEKENLRQIEFCGHVDDIGLLAQYYKNASVFMMTSNFEGFGMTLIEAQAYGCVPIAFDNFAALRDIISNHTNGVIVPTNDYRSYAEQLKTLINDRISREEMARNSLASHIKFNRENHYRKWTELFKKLGITSDF